MNTKNNVKKANMSQARQGGMKTQQTVLVVVRESEYDYLLKLPGITKVVDYSNNLYKNDSPFPGYKIAMVICMVTSVNNIKGRFGEHSIITTEPISYNPQKLNEIRLRIQRTVQKYNMMLKKQNVVTQEYLEKTKSEDVISVGVTEEELNNVAVSTAIVNSGETLKVRRARRPKRKPLTDDVEVIVNE